MSYSIFEGTIADMTYPEVRDAARQGALVLWGFGVIEQHGPHLPLATDVYLPQILLRGVKALLEKSGISSIIMPPFYWGINNVTGIFPGSFEVRPQVMVELMIDLIKSVKKDGFGQLFCVSGHGDALHNRTLLDGIRRGAAEAAIEAYVIGSPDFFTRLGVDAAHPHTIATGREVERKTQFVDVHAGRLETSSMRRYFPDIVRRDVIAGLKPTELGPDGLAEWRKGREAALRMTPDGYLGDPAASDPQLGEELLAEQTRLVADAIATKARPSRDRPAHTPAIKF
ncbi:MAG: creatininase family protein [Alphaproteobacteria bacterium]|nr:creatininase family protein [Alphaproteobacteria bacterium]